jgi:hypothetical protein
MGEPIVILALRRKRDRIESAIAGYERKIKEAQADLSHVTASLRLFSTLEKSAVAWTEIGPR